MTYDSYGRLVRATLVLALVFPAQLISSNDWTQWRGSGQRGHFSDSPDLSAARRIEFEVVWRRPMGSGYSAFVSDSGRAYSMAAQEGQDFVIAFDLKDGETLWRHSLGETYFGHDGSDDGPTSSPALDSGMVFALSAQGLFVALDSETGQRIWSYDLPKDFGSKPPDYGFSTAPIVEGDLVFLLTGGSAGNAGKAITAFDKRSGRVVWATGDGAVRHQRPSLATLAGTRQLITAFEEQIVGLSPEDGAVLWTLPIAKDFFTQLFSIDDKRFLTHGFESSSLIQVEKEGDALRARQLWETRNLKRNHAVPVYIDGHIYGFNSRFLTCLNAETGETVWKSRPPGGEQLGLWNGHLLIPSRNGDLVAVKADPKGYAEIGRISIFERPVFTPPSFASGRILLRDLREAVVVRARPGDAKMLVKAAPSAFPESDFGRFVNLLVSTDEEMKARLISDFARDNPELPLTEGNLVHFVYLGAVPELAISGDMTGHWAAEPMRRIPGADFYYRSYAIEPGNRWEYRFHVFDEPRIDPRNPNRIENDDGPVSVVEEQGWTPYPTAPATAEGGALRPLRIPRKEGEEPWKLQLYTPAGYDRLEGTLPLVVIGDGARALRFGGVKAILDREIGKSVAPLIVAFLELPDWIWYDAYQKRFGEILAQEILPELERSYRISRDREQRLLLSHGHREQNHWTNTSTLLRTAFRFPDLFGNIAIQSPILKERFRERVLLPLNTEKRFRLYLDWGRYDARNVYWGVDVRRQAPEAARFFLEHGHRVTAGEQPGGSGWFRWRNQIGEILRLFFSS